MVRRLRATREPAPLNFEVHPANWPALQAFRLYAASQWRIAPSGAPYGLDYAAVAAAVTLDRAELEPGTFEKLRVLESTIVRNWSQADD